MTRTPACLASAPPAEGSTIAFFAGVRNSLDAQSKENVREDEANRAQAAQDKALAQQQKQFDATNALEQRRVDIEQGQADKAGQYTDAEIAKMSAEEKRAAAQDARDAALLPLKLKLLKGQVDTATAQAATAQIDAAIAKKFGVPLAALQVQQGQANLAQTQAGTALTQAQTGEANARTASLRSAPPSYSSDADALGHLSPTGRAFSDMVFSSTNNPPTPMQALAAISDPRNNLTKSDRDILSGFASGAGGSLPNASNQPKLAAAAYARSLVDQGLPDISGLVTQYKMTANQQEKLVALLHEMQQSTNPSETAKDLPPNAPDGVKTFVNSYAQSLNAPKGGRPSQPSPAAFPSIPIGRPQGALGMRRAAAAGTPAPAAAATPQRPAGVPADAVHGKFRGTSGWASGAHFWSDAGQQVI